MANTKPRKVYQNPKKNHAEMVNTFRARRTLKIFGQKRWPGEIVPEAHTWLRVNNFTHSGYIEEVRIPETEFDKAVKQYCPDLAERLAELAKGAPVAEKDDTKFTGFVFNEDGQVEDVAAQRRLARERELANTAPNDRPLSFDNGGTPAYQEEHSPDHVHSDGGPTLYSEKQVRKLDELMDPKRVEFADSVDQAEGSTPDEREAEDKSEVRPDEKVELKDKPASEKKDKDDHSPLHEQPTKAPRKSTK